MGMRLVTLAVVSATLAVVSIGAAASAGVKQRVAITSRSGVYLFTLTPLKSGAVKRDTGTVSWGSASERVIFRDGQRIEIDNVLATLTGKKGTLQLHFRIEWLNAGNAYVIGAGQWTVVRGTGAYEHASGGGRSASSWLPRGPVSFRAEGFLRA